MDCPRGEQSSAFICNLAGIGLRSGNRLVMDDRHLNIWCNVPNAFIVVLVMVEVEISTHLATILSSTKIQGMIGHSFQHR